MNVGYMQACANLFLICDAVEGLRTNPRVDVLQEDRGGHGILGKKSNMSSPGSSHVTDYELSVFAGNLRPWSQG